MKSASLRLGLAFSLLIGVVVLLMALGANEWVRPVLEAISSAGPLAPLLFVILHALAVVLLVPGILMPLGAGFLFGVGLGTFVSIAGKTLGTAIALSLSRSLLKHRASEFMTEHPTLAKLDKALPELGWRAVVLIRLVPVIPFKLSNYMFGLTRFRRRDVLVGTAVGAVPFSLLNAYLGSAAATASGLGASRGPQTRFEWFLWLTGLALSIAATCTIAIVARKVLKRAVDEGDESPDSLDAPHDPAENEVS